MNRDDFQYVIPSTTGGALLDGDFEPELVARVGDTHIPRSELPITVDVDVYDVPGPSFLLVLVDDVDRYFFADGGVLDGLADAVADGDADLLELADGDGPFRDRLEDRYFVDEDQGVDAHV
jgi:hypothetical protein